MKNYKVMVVISWIVSLAFFFVAVSNIDGGISKMVIGQLGLALGWLIIGIIYWKKGKRKESKL